MRAVLGRKVFGLLQTFAPQVTFLAPEVAFDDVREHLAGWPSVARLRLYSPRWPNWTRCARRCKP